MLSVNTYKKKELHMKLRRRKLVNGNFSPFKLLMFWFFKARRVFIGHFKNKINPNQAKKSEDQNTFIPHPPSYKKKKKEEEKKKEKCKRNKELWKYAMSLIGIYPTKIATAADKDIMSCVLQLSSWCQKIWHNLNVSWCGMC